MTRWARAAGSRFSRASEKPRFKRRKTRLLPACLLISILLLSGCAENSVQMEAPNPSSTPIVVPSSHPSARSFTPEPTSQPALTSTSTPTQPEPTETPSAKQPESCTEKSQLRAVSLPAQAFGQTLELIAYLPPCHTPDREGGYPALILLHGQGYEPSQWLDLGLQETADRLIASGQIPAMLVLMPLERYALQDPNQSSFDAMLLEVLLPWAREALLACTHSDCLAAGGISRGGAWALRLGIEHPERFHAIGMHSAPPFPSDQYRSIYTLRDLEEKERPALYLDVGDQDLYRSHIAALHEDLRASQIEHIWMNAAGGHDDAYWQEHLEEYLLWYGAELVSP